MLCYFLFSLILYLSCTLCVLVSAFVVLSVVYLRRFSPQSFIKFKLCLNKRRTSTSRQYAGLFVFFPSQRFLITHCHKSLWCARTFMKSQTETSLKMKSVGFRTRNWSKSSYHVYTFICGEICYKPTTEMMEAFVWGITQTTSMCYSEKPPMHLQIASNSPVTKTKTELGVSNCGPCDTC